MPVHALNRPDPVNDVITLKPSNATADDWLNVAIDILMCDGVDEVKVQTIGSRLGVPRSTFYWHFKSRSDLLLKVLAIWERSNTQTLISFADGDANTITGALCNVFRCLMDRHTFNAQLDVAIRNWAKGDGKVRNIVDRADRARQQALAEMFMRHGFPEAEATVRAHALYCQQIGYQALDLSESIEEKLPRVEQLIRVFTGEEADWEELLEFQEDMRRCIDA